MQRMSSIGVVIKGMDLVDKWTTERSINDGNKNNLKTYWDKFEEYIHPKTNKLIAVVEFKWLFQGTLSLEDFHTKASRLVIQAGYTGDAKDRVLRDTIISGIASEKIRAKIVKEGHEVSSPFICHIIHCSPFQYRQHIAGPFYDCSPVTTHSCLSPLPTVLS